jgi:hypothetical protein
VKGVLPLAHAGHYAIWVFYALPVVVVVGAIARSAILTRRADRDGEDFNTRTSPTDKNE